MQFLRASLEIVTHDKDELIIQSAFLPPGTLTARIYDGGKSILIKRNFVNDLLAAGSKQSIKIFIPAGAILEVGQTSGEIKLSGNYEQLNIQCTTANILADLNALNANRKSILKSSIGKIDCPTPSNSLNTIARSNKMVIIEAPETVIALQNNKRRLNKI
ncbi:MAG: hypothetical protein RIQ89_1884 [Bacteroidota bacterium]